MQKAEIKSIHIIINKKIIAIIFFLELCKILYNKGVIQYNKNSAPKYQN